VSQTPVTRDHPAHWLPPEESTGEHELKFVLPEARAASALAWMQRVCRRDPSHPVSTVSTVYYDTPRLTRLDEKLNSDYLKTKIRLRWYDAPGVSAGGVHLEVKERIGALRRKVREPVDLNAGDLALLPLHSPVFHDVLVRLRPLGFDPAALRPVFLIRYERHRFIDATGARASLDRNLRIVRVNAQAVPRVAPLPVGTAVVEIKGREEQLPRGLEGLLRLGLRQTSFSKFAVCYLELMRLKA